MWLKGPQTCFSSLHYSALLSFLIVGYTEVSAHISALFPLLTIVSLREFFFPTYYLCLTFYPYSGYVLTSLGNVSYAKRVGLFSLLQACSHSTASPTGFWPGMTSRILGRRPYWHLEVAWTVTVSKDKRVLWACPRRCVSQLPDTTHSSPLGTWTWTLSACFHHRMK